MVAFRLSARFVTGLLRVPYPSTCAVSLGLRPVRHMATAGDGRQSTARRDALQAIEAQVRTQWETEKVFESHVAKGVETFFATFPFPYMNGMLHIGHAFTVMKADIAVHYWRKKWQECPFPFWVSLYRNADSGGGK